MTIMYLVCEPVFSQLHLNSELWASHKGLGPFNELEELNEFLFSRGEPWKACEQGNDVI